jgi:hypothetical protein
MENPMNRLISIENSFDQKSVIGSAMNRDIFFEIHQGTPKGVPGLNEYRRKAFKRLPNLDNPPILDVGRGTGRTTLEPVRCQAEARLWQRSRNFVKLQCLPLHTIAKMQLLVSIPSRKNKSSR